MNNKILGNAIVLARRIAKVYGRNVYVATGMKGFEVYEKKPQFYKRFYHLFPIFLFFGENLYRYKNILLKSSNNIFAIPSGHGIEAPSALSCSLHRLFVKLVFQNVFRGKTI